ncbi:MAG: immune inhibitor A [Ignavibacteriales bacterium]|nr:MAG: immune inhibitor A [Ignavibacteriales bacterium]
MKTLFTLLFALMISFTTYSQNYKQVKIYLNHPSDIQSLMNSGFEFDHPNLSKDNAVVAYLSDNDFAKIQTSGFSYEVLIDDWYEYYNNLPQLTDLEKSEFIEQSKREMNVSGFGYGSMGGFYTLAEVIAELDSMKQMYPNLITTKVSIGNTIESRPMYMVKISDNPDVDENEPEILYTALHHAREPQGMMTLIYYMYYLLENYNSDPSIQYLVNNRELYFIPVVNPDGYEYNRSTSPSGGGMWRKNRRNNSGSYGVDLNRNYGPMTYWNAPNGGSSTSPSSDTYRGTAPFSEPETNNIKNFLATRKLKNALNYHTYSNLLIYPYGALSHETSDSLIFREYAIDMTAYNGYTYGTDMQTVGYSTRGNSDDYFYDGDVALNSGKIFAMTPEVGSTGFWPSQAEIFPLAIENLKPNLYYAWVAGEYVSMVNGNYSQQYFNPGDNVLMNPVFKNKGLSSGYNITVELTALNSYATVTSGTASFDSIPARGTASVSSPLSFTVSPSAPSEGIIKLLLTARTNGTVMNYDTLNLIVGVPTFVFADTTNNPLTLWTIAGTPTTAPKWAATTSSFNTAPNSYTDSPSGNYVANSTVTMTLTNPINLSGFTNPRLTYYTKWDIESDWDYGQVEISTNNGSTWIPLQGQYMNPGTGSFQPNGEPLYDGTRAEWVREEISLASYISSTVKFRFELKTDGSQQRDGWYVDDIGVIYYTILPVELTSFTANATENNVLLKWSTSSEINNRGFEILRKKSDETGWMTVGYVEGSGTTTDAKEYKFVDKSPLNGKNIYRLKQIDFDGTFKLFNSVEADFNGIKNYELEQNYPNPFNPSTQIKYALPKSGFVTLKVYNLLGAEVATLINEYKEAGRHSVEFNSENENLNLSSGVYVYSIRVNDFVQTRKMLMLK